MNFAQELTTRAVNFWVECALPLAAKSDAAVQEERFGDAGAARLLFEDWLIDRCLWLQPVPVYLSSPSGRVVVASRHAFLSKNNLSRFQFDWPLSHDVSRFRRALKGRRLPDWKISDDYAFLSDAFTLDLGGANPRPRGAFIDAYIKALRPFDGWSACLRPDDLQDLRASVTDAFKWTRIWVGDDGQPGSEEPLSSGGRPSKQDPTRVAYQMLYPNGHEAAGVTLKVACNKIEAAIGVKVSMDTLKRVLGKRK